MTKAFCDSSHMTLQAVQYTNLAWQQQLSGQQCAALRGEAHLVCDGMLMLLLYGKEAQCEAGLFFYFLAAAVTGLMSALKFLSMGMMCR